MKKRTFLIIFVLFLTLLGFIYRFYGLPDNHSFWIDEFSTGQAASAIVKSGSPQTITGAFEVRNLLNHYLTAGSMKIFGINEFAARFPSVIWGTLIIFVSFLIFEKIFNTRIGLGVAVLATFSVMEITWSRQARSYALFQLLFLLSSFYLWRLGLKIKGKEKIVLTDCLIPAIFLVFSFLSHLLTISLVVVFLLYLLLFARKELVEIFKNSEKKQKWILGFFTLFFVVLLWQAGLGQIVQNTIVLGKVPLKIYNNVWYYHSFFWRQYPLVFFLSLLGLVGLAINKEKKLIFPVMVVAVHLVFVVFLLKWLDIRYLLPVFPLFFFAFLLYFLDQLGGYWFGKRPMVKSFFILGLVFFIVFNGYKFNFRPKAFYSPNADMKEIPLVDYNLVYSLIQKEIEKTGPSVVVIDTWLDKVVWYLGRDYPKAYWIRAKSEVGGDGVEQEGKTYDKFFHYQGIFSEKDLLEVIKANPKGFILIDGHEVPFIPKDALSYIENNLKLELKLDRFLLDPDPYDTWPVWLYSWGLGDEENLND